MNTCPAFDPRFRVTIVPGDGVFFVSDHGGADLLSAQVYERIAPLIDGCRTSDEIADALEPDIDLAVSYYALLQLERHGYIRDVGEAVAADERASAIDLEAIVARLGPDAARANLVVADDYLAPELEAINRHALSELRPWILAKIVGEQIWLGPLFVPGETACWCCLAQRHRTLSPVEAYLDQRRRVSTVIAAPASVPRASLARLAAAVEQATNGRSLDAGVVIRFDIVTGDISFETVERRPQCPACGDASLYRTQLERFDLARSRTAMTPPVAVAATISRINSSCDELIHVYAAAPAAVYDASDAATLSTALRYRCVGSGVTRADGMTAVIAETIERYSGTVHGDEPRIRASFDSLAERGIHPNACMLYSATQYATRRLNSVRAEPTAMVPEPFDPGAAVDWTPVWSLTTNEIRFLPTAFLYRGAPTAAGAEMCVADTNGCAAGTSLGDSIVRGFLELVERDSIALWWYRRLQCPAVDFATIGSSYCRDVRAAYRAMGRELWLLDITTDLGVPAYAAVSCLTDDTAPGREIMFGFGAHFDAERAAIHAVTEMNQLVASASARVDAGASPSPQFDRWMKAATIDGQAHLTPHGMTSLRGSGDACDTAECVDRCRAIVESRGMEFLVLDQSRADVALPVVKVIVPGLRPAAARFAPGRLYLTDRRDAGTLDECDEQSLNPVPFFL